MKAIESNGCWHHIEIDLIDLRNYADHNHGYKWILTVLDIFSKFAFAYPLLAKDPDYVIDALDDLFNKEGTPGIVQSDNGTEFRASSMTAFLGALKVEVRHGRPRHPQSQGQIERYARTQRRACDLVPARANEESHIVLA
jgi:transposase InsO family protein